MDGLWEGFVRFIFGVLEGLGLVGMGGDICAAYGMVFTVTASEHCGYGYIYTHHLGRERWPDWQIT